MLRVAANSSVQDVAHAIFHAVQDSKRVTLRAVGAGAVNQAIKACAIARGMTAVKGVDIMVRPGFADIEIKGMQVSAITLQVLRT